MTRLYGWGPTRERVAHAVPFGHRKTTTLVAAFRLDGLFAPVVIDGATTGELFRADVRQQVAPHLRVGDILVMGNPAAHKVAGVEEAVRGAGRGCGVPAAVPPGHEPDRAGVLEDQDGATPAGDPDHPGVGRRVRGEPRRDHHDRRPELLCELGIPARIKVKVLYPRDVVRGQHLAQVDQPGDRDGAGTTGGRGMGTGFPPPVRLRARTREVELMPTRRPEVGR